MRLIYFLLLLFIPLIVGCDGCRKSDPNATPVDDSEPLSDFQTGKTLAFPSDQKTMAGHIKPGHWVTASLGLKSNNVDSRGELQSRASIRVTSTNKSGSTVTTDFGIRSNRPVVLPKGQMRQFDFRLLAPASGGSSRNSITVGSRFISSGRGSFFDTGRQPFISLSGPEFFFVVLTSRPQSFTQIQVADWVRPFRDSETEMQSAIANYKIIFPSIKEVLPLPETMLDWTSTAVVLWDDADPNSLTPSQQRAMADWVRFGGQLIVNGATGSDAIAKTQLADLLPLKPTSNIELNAAAAEELLQGWEIGTDPSTRKQAALAREQSGVAVDGRLNPGALAVEDTGNLILQRQIGRGRILQSRFDLASDWIKGWESFSGFFNSVVLLRPHREFMESQRNEISINSISQKYVDYPLAVGDATMNTRFRIATRDAILRVDDRGKEGERKRALTSRSRLDTLTYVDSVRGISGWTDSSDAMSLCQDILRDESGIEIPETSLLVKSLSWYLLILVPVNYLIFRLWGKLEYAWLAVPIIAIGGAIWVARAARLDIGFARSQTDVGVLELAPDYQRGHLTRIVAIYNSLSSTYQVQFKTIDGAAAPVGGYRSDEDNRQLTFNTSFDEGPALDGIAVPSNQARMVHTEEIVDIGGGLRLDGDSLINSSSLELLETFVLSKDSEGAMKIAAVGLFEPNSKVQLNWREESMLAFDEALPMQMQRMLERFGAPAAMPLESIRLIARIDGTVSNATISPVATQTKSQTVVLAHLKHPPLPKPQRDVNLLTEFVRKRQKDWEKEMEQDAKRIE